MKWIDISHTLNNETPVFPGDYNTTLKKVKTLEANKYNGYLLNSCLHTGTHVDLPMHMLDDPRTVPDFSVESFAGEGVLLDVRGENPICVKPEYRTNIPEGCVVLLRTGHSEYFFEQKYFTEYPVIHSALAELFVSKKIKMVGMDIPSPDYAPYEIHKLLLSNDILLLENLVNLESVPESGFEVLALPLKLSAEASLVRAVCRING